MKTLAFITSKEDPLLIEDDQLAFAPLRNLGFCVKPLIWDHEPDLKQFDALVFRSCWNYHRKYELFCQWLEKVEKSKLPVLNSIEVSKWNLNKKYLLELHAKGAFIPRTKWIAKGSKRSKADLQMLLKEIAAEQVVIKPAVSLNGHDTFLVKSDNIEKAYQILTDLLPQKDILLQEYISQIKTSGEMSLIFFNGTFSHAITKTPGETEFRVHEEYGGTRFAVTPSPTIVAQARAILKMVDSPLLFARVDIVERDGRAVLTELEIIDPMLYLGYSDGAPDRFASAIAATVNSDPSTGENIRGGT